MKLSVPKKAILYFLYFSPLLIVFFSIFIGRLYIPAGTVLRIIISKIFSLTPENSWPRAYEVIIFEIRLPRIIAAVLGGIALSVSGASLQAVFRNPLVDTYILGVSAGSAFGAALAISLLLLDSFLVQIFAFIFGIIAFGTTYLVAKTQGDVQVISLILAGIIVSSLFSACLSIIKFIVEPNHVADIVYWLMGRFSTISWKEVLQLFPPILIGSLILFGMRWRLNALSMKDEEAKMLGINVERERLLVLGAATLVSASLISVCGIIGWIGLIIPHTIRMLFKTADNRKIIPLSAATGASILLLADNIARSLLPYEIPVGILTTLCGAPFFLYLLRKRSKGVWH
ncbi:MAG: FecCD family ABC transporter permease [Candidatus Heimdallarchaeaceae archaeon]